MGSKNASPKMRDQLHLEVEERAEILHVGDAEILGRELQHDGDAARHDEVSGRGAQQEQRHRREHGSAGPLALLGEQARDDERPELPDPDRAGRDEPGPGTRLQRQDERAEPWLTSDLGLAPTFLRCGCPRCRAT